MDDRIERLARLVVEFGANVQPGQLVEVFADLGKEEFARAIAAVAYDRGAKFVEVTYYDPRVKHVRVSRVRDEWLEYIPPWWGERVLELGRARAASISLAGPAAPHLFDDLDPERLGRDIFPRVKEWNQVTNDRTVNWCIAPCPTPDWAVQVHPELEPAAAFDRLWDEISHVCRLDEADPPAAWRQRSATLKDVSQRLNERAFDAVQFQGDGTDLTVGLLPTSRWNGGGDETVDGIAHMPNLPTEEVFTAPDPERAEGTVRATMPLVASGATIDGLRVRFEGGRAVEIDADKGADTMRAFASRDEGASRLGEVALVDREGRIGSTGTVFYDTLLDENAASHVALGDAYDSSVEPEDHERLNRSEIHVDFMIGDPSVDVTGITRDGERVPVLREGLWQI
ncbi:MAG: aminopeptidase [Gaiellaceae bacterium]